jgi:hypothetical protein
VGKSKKNKGGAKKPVVRPDRRQGEIDAWLAKAPGLNLARPKNQAIILALYAELKEAGILSDEDELLESTMIGLIGKTDEVLERAVGQPYVYWIESVPSDIQMACMMQYLDSALGKDNS